jgi:hypothetical protein
LTATIFFFPTVTSYFLFPPASSSSVAGAVLRADLLKPLAALFA